MGLFEIESREFNDKRRFPTVYVNLKIADLLIIAETIEGLLCDRAYAKKEVTRKFTVSALPKHKGFGMVAIFNQLFKGVAQWRRMVNETMLWVDPTEVELELFDLMFQSDACQIDW